MKHSFKSIIIRRIKKKHNIIGMTMAELLIVLAVLAVLFGVAFIAVQRYLRSMGQLERDKIAMEIFVAAQNHLTVEYGRDYAGVSASDFGNEDSSLPDVYYFVYNDGVNYTAGETSVLDHMLPFGSLDETIRAGGSYIIQYNKKAGKVLNVFYCSTNASPKAFNHSLEIKDYSSVKELAEESKKSLRRDWTDGHHILGWYGGEAALDLPHIELKAPTILVKNAEKLSVEIKDNNDSTLSGQYIIKLIITGKTSGAQKGYVLKTESGSSSEPVDSSGRLKAASDSGYDHEVILDDITTSGMQFSYIYSEKSEPGNPSKILEFIPGEDISIQAIAYSTSNLATVASSSKKTTNSLFASVADTADLSGNMDGKIDTAYIRNIRHLENLDQKVSSLDSNDKIAGNEDIHITSAVQTSHMDWDKFKNKTHGEDTRVYYFDAPGTTYRHKSGVPSTSIKFTDKENYYPITPDYSLDYDGARLSISNIVTKGAHAGLFGNPASVGIIKDLELIDFSITGTESAGALAGSLTGTTISNVIARKGDTPSKSDPKVTVTADNANAGGLIGKLQNGRIEYSAASLIVDGKLNSGGLIGYFDTNDTNPNTVEINGCYSGGHTKNGSYQEWVNDSTHTYDVVGKNAGGLIGYFCADSEITNASIKNSYSTCSVSRTADIGNPSGAGPADSYAGGFLGTAKGMVSNCYATGLVAVRTIVSEDQKNINNNVGAFAGNLTGSLNDCLYFSLINEVMAKQKNNDKLSLDHYLGVVGDSGPKNEEGNTVIPGITGIDDSAESYNNFVAEEDHWGKADPYDRDTLLKYYRGKYNLRSILRPEWKMVGNSEPNRIYTDNYDKNTGLIKVTAEDSSMLGSSLTDYFVSTHYGDWPSPEIFIINN